MSLNVEHVFMLMSAVFVMFDIADCCSCALSHPQLAACKSDFVIIADVKSETVDELDKTYDVNIVKVLNVKPSSWSVLKNRKLLTASSDSMCGVSLLTNVQYLITGRVYNNQSRISLCSYIKPWKDLTFRQRKGFRLLYYKGCKCEIIQCPWWEDCQLPPESCPWDINNKYGQTDCHSQHSVCYQQEDGSCKWLHGRHYRNCDVKQRDV